MLSESRFNALSKITGLSFYTAGGEELFRCPGEGKRLKAVYVSIPDLRYGGYSEGLHSRNNVQWLKENLGDSHWLEITGYYGQHELLLDATGEYYAETLRILSALDAYAALYDEDENDVDGYALDGVITE